MSSIEFIGALNMGIIYSFVALGVYLSFRTLQFPDMTVDGSFPLGAAVTAILIVSGYNPLFATAAAFLAGSVSGIVTAIMATRLKILNLLAGIITMAALYSINLRIMGRPNISLIGEMSLISYFEGKLVLLLSIPNNIARLIILSILILLTMGLLYRFLLSRIGLALRATGNNPIMARAQGISDEKMIVLGLAIANGMAALGGSLFTQINGFADVNMGIGTIIIGLAAVIVGETFISPNRVLKAILGVVLGALIYRLIIAIALKGGSFGLRASDLNLVTASLVAIAMSLPHLKKQFYNKKSG